MRPTGKGTETGYVWGLTAPDLPHDEGMPD